MEFRACLNINYKPRWPSRLLDAFDLTHLQTKVPKSKENKTDRTMVIVQKYGAKESKFWNVSNPGASIGISALRLPLTSSVACGTDMYQSRIGRKIRVKRIFFRGIFLGAQTNSVADDPYNTMRVVVMRCLPATTLSGSLTTTNALDRRFNAGLLDVMYDRVRTLCVNAKDSTGYVAVAADWEFSISCDVLIEYGSAAASTPINQELVLQIVSDSSAVVNPGFSTNSTYGIEYVDDA